MNRLILLIIILLSTFSQLSAQYEKRQQADILFKSSAYAAATEILLKIEESGSGDLETKVKLGLSYYHNRDFKSALEWMKKAKEVNQLSKEHEILLAELYRMNGELTVSDSLYSELKKAFPDLKSKSIHNSTALSNIRPSNYSVLAIPGLNTAQDEMCPAYYRDGLVFVSSVSKKKKKYQRNDRAWLSVQSLPYKPKGGERGAATPFKGPLNDFLHSGPVSFAQKDNLMFFSKNTALRGNGESGSANLGLFYTVKKSGKWQTAKAFKYNSKKYSISHPALSPDGKELYFVSDMPGGYGGTDIYYTKYSNGTWSTPINLGNQVNTAKNEMFPVVHADKTIYFSSEGLPGFGGLDIFSTQFEGGFWIKASNLGQPLNSGFDDFSLVLNKDKTEGYFTSNRTGGQGNDDIYRVIQGKVEELCTFKLGGMVSDKLTLAAVANAEVSVSNDVEIIGTVQADEVGFYTIALPCELEQFTVRVSSPGYFPYENVLQREKGEKEFPLNIYLDKVELNKSIVVPNIYYDLDKAEITAAAGKELDKLKALLDRNPSWIVEIGAHTDSRSDDNYNLKLSEKRAKAAIDYLNAKGISSSRLFSKGYGETKLINECKDGVKCAEEQHAKNRRTEFRLIGYEKFAYEEEGVSKQADRVIFAQDYQVGKKALVYKIQVGVFTNPDLSILQKFSDLGNLTLIPIEGSTASKYLLEAYDSYSTAQGYLLKVQQRGIVDAFIVAFKDGKVIAVKDALDLEKKNK